MIIRNNKKIDSEGFTLIELLVVISIIALLSTIVLGALNDSREKARITKARQDMKEIYNAFLLYVSDNNGFGPKSLENSTNGYNAWNVPDCADNQNISGGDVNIPDLFDRPNQQYIDYYESELSPYLSEIPLDPWGGRYVVDAVYNCGTTYGDQVGCKETTDASDWVWAIYSGGPDLGADTGGVNGPAPAHYNADNIVFLVCDHAN